MSEAEIREIREKVCRGIEIAQLKLISRKIQEDSEIVVAKGKRITRLRGKHLKIFEKTCRTQLTPQK